MGVRLENAGIIAGNFLGGDLTESGGNSDTGIGVVGSCGNLIGGTLSGTSGGFLAVFSSLFLFSSIPLEKVFSLIPFLSRLFRLSTLDIGGVGSAVGFAILF